MAGEMLLLPIPLVFVLLGMIFALAGVSKLRTGRALVGLDGGDIGDVGDGYAFVAGTAERTDGQVTAPFTGVDCLAYEVAVQQRVQQTNGSFSWNTYDTDRDQRRFLVTDGIQSVAVEPDGADLDFGNDHVHLSESGAAPTGPYAQYVRTHDVYTFDDEGVSEAQHVRYVERRLTAGDEVSIIGPSDTDETGRSVLRNGDGGLLDRVGAKPFIVSDSPIEPPSFLGRGLFLVALGGIFAGGGGHFVLEIL